MTERYKDKYYYDALAKAIEQVTGEVVRIHFQIGTKYNKERWMGMVSPDMPFYLPFSCNKPHATYWVEANSFEEVVEQLMELTGVEHKDEWYFTRPEY